MPVFHTSSKPQNIQDDGVIARHREVPRFPELPCGESSSRCVRLLGGSRDPLFGQAVPATSSH